MTQTSKWTALAVAAVMVAAMAAALLLPGMALASASSRQKNKNVWRNLAIGSGAVAAYGLTHHNGTLTTLGVAGTGYSAYRYEKDRKRQSELRAARERYYRHYRAYHHSYRHARLRKR